MCCIHVSGQRLTCVEIESKKPYILYWDGCTLYYISAICGYIVDYLAHHK